MTTSGPRSCSATTSCRSPGTATRRAAPSSSATPTATSSSSSTRAPGRLRTEYGPLDYRAGDYLVVPRGTTYRFEPAEPTDLLVVEAYESRFQLPDKGLLGRHALFDPAMLEVPEAEAIDEEGEFTVVVKRLGQDTRVTYPFHPCDVVGWKGDVAPMRINVDDFRPVTSARYHLPPSAHTTFVADGFVVCTFAPRPLEEDPDALRLPFFHRNIDFDEVILYHRGEFFSRAGIDEGMLTWHPFGLHHGPQPGARARDAAAAAAPTGERRMADEVAVMIDARHALVPARRPRTSTWRATSGPGRPTREARPVPIRPRRLDLGRAGHRRAGHADRARRGAGRSGRAAGRGHGAPDRAGRGRGARAGRPRARC